jgi:hypothetical protein
MGVRNGKGRYWRHTFHRGSKPNTEKNCCNAIGYLYLFCDTLRIFREWGLRHFRLAFGIHYTPFTGS